MVAIRFSGEEMEALTGFGYSEELGRYLLSPEAVMIYMCFLRPRMDFATGLIGYPASVSYGGLRKELSRYEGKARNTLANATVQQLRRLLGELIEAGLLERREHPNPRGFKVVPMLFFAPLAGCDLVSVNSKQHGGNAGGRHKDRACGKGGEAHELQGGDGISEGVANDGRCSVGFTESQRISSLSADINNHNTSCAREALRGDGYAIPKDWVPEVSMVDRLVVELRVPAEFILAYVPEFRIYWVDTCEIRSSWNKVFYRRCKNMEGTAEWQWARQQYESSLLADREALRA